MRSGARLRRNLFHGNQDGIPRRHELEPIVALAFGLRIELGRGKDLLAPGLHHPPARHERAGGIEYVPTACATISSLRSE